MRIVMPTCDSHIAAAQASGRLLHKYWPDRPALRVVHHCARPEIDGAEFFFAGPQAETSWIEAMTRCVRGLHEDTFLLLLDDYGLSGPVRSEMIETARRLVSGNPSAAMCALCWYPGTRSPAADGFCRMLPAPVLLQAAVWRVDSFLGLAGAVNPKCSPWGFESAATQAIKRMGLGIFAPDLPATCHAGRMIDGMDKADWPLPYHNLMDRGAWAAEHVTFLIREGIDVPSRGLGDAVAKALHAVGLDRLTPADCGCARRQEALNAAMPFREK